MLNINADEYFSSVELCDKLLASDIAILCNVFIIIIIIYIMFLEWRNERALFQTSVRFFASPDI